MNAASRFFAVVLVLSGLALAVSAQQPSAPFTHLYDTGAVHGGPIPPSLFATRDGWSEITDAAAVSSFNGHAVFMNDRIAAVVRIGGPGVELYSIDGASAALRATLVACGPNGAQAFQYAKPVSVSEDEVVLDCEAAPSDGVVSGLRLTLSVGQVFVRASALGATESIQVIAPCEYIVLPDFFADDMVIGRDDFSGEAVEVPSENFLMQLCDDGHAIVMSVWQNRDQDVKVTKGKAEGAPIESSRVSFGKDGNVWVAVLASPGIWHARDVSLNERNAVIPLKWKRPFPAVWRVDWRRDDRLTDSWEMAIENPDGSFRKSELFENGRDEWTDKGWWADDMPRYRWNTGGIGGYMYPCWFDKKNSAYLQPLEKTVRFEGPAIIYPINRSADTPLDCFTVTDLVRTTLGMGPCQYILDLEGQDQTFRGKPTCATRDFLNPIYSKGEQKEREEEVLTALDDVLTFMHMIRGRIEQYIAFSRDMDAFLSAQRTEHPESAAFLDEMTALNHQIDVAVDRRRQGMRPAGDADMLVNEFRTTLIGYEGHDAAQKCKKLTEQFVRIGDNQDELVAECRLAVKVLRQRAALAGAREPQAAPIVARIREMTQSILRDPVNYEAARH